MAERLLTPSKITAWLDCAHYLTLKHEVEAGTRTVEFRPSGSFADLLRDKGLEHEAACLAQYEADGQRVLSVDEKHKGETFAAWTARVRPALDADVDVIFQMPFVHDGIRGVADFLERTVDPATSAIGWLPVDAKLARKEAKPGHVLQLCFYADAIHAQTGVKPTQLKVWLGSDEKQEIEYEAVRPYWDRLRNQLRQVLDTEPGEGDATHPERCDHCTFCEFQDTCEQVWRDEDSLIYVADIRRADRDALEPAGVSTLTALSQRTDPVGDLKAERLARIQVQAALQAEADEAQPPPPFRPIAAVDDSPWGHGFGQLPEPDDGDLFLDFEGHPFWTAKRGLFFLFGYISNDGDGWAFHQLWAHDEDEEKARVEELIHAIAARRAQYPGMHVYHYNHTERSSLVSLTTEYATAEAVLDDLIHTGVFVDLMTIAKNAVQVGVESYGLKHLEHLTEYERSHDIEKGAGAVVAYDEYTDDGDEAHLTAIAAYNEDDVRATMALRDWLLEQRPKDLAWWQLEVKPSKEATQIDALLEMLAKFDEGSVQHIVADLLGYWIRERRAYFAPIVSKLTDEPAGHLDDLTVIAHLGIHELVDRLTPTGRKAKWPGLKLRFPPQTIASKFVNHPPKKVIYLSVEGQLCFTKLLSFDVDAGELVLDWNQPCLDADTIPMAVVADEWFDPRSKRAALVELAHQVIDPASHGEPNPLTLALLREGHAPTFIAGGGPPDGQFTDDIDDLARWITELDGDVLGVQGPPGTGKTYRGAHIAKALVSQGKRVGITAMSHHAIGNFLEEIVRVFAEEPVVPLRAIRKHDEPDDGGLPGITYTDDSADLAGDDYDIVAGTAWALTAKAMRKDQSTGKWKNPIDVLLIDEAGQLALIDAVVSSMSARNVVLLGDPQQLPQVAQATHPRQSGDSALGHILGDHATMPADRGVFISETRRMHPDVCAFISDRIYDGKLTSHADCAKQGTDLGTGLRWLEVNHAGCSTESEIEADAVIAQIHEVLGQHWTDKHGVSHTITADDVMVVAPYNDQKDLLRAKLDADPATRGLQVGTVDKFQGRQAPIVFFTMTASSADDMHRGADFLFSTNRLNVAISRAQCLAYLVCTKELLESRAKTVEDMLLIANLCAFVEHAQG
jgi:uncharacterized protein